jgi:electron transfer flavoprotein alpha subunit
MAVLVIAEHDNAKLAAATRSAITAALQLASGPVHVLVAGYAAGSVVEDVAHIAGVDKVVAADADVYAHGIAEPLSDLIVSLAAGYDAILAAATTFGKNLLPRVAALLDVSQISDIVGIAASDTFTRVVYAGSAVATVQSRDRLKVITVRATAFALAQNGADAPVVSVAAVASTQAPALIDRNIVALERPELTAARVVVSGGRGLGSKEGFALIARLADTLGAAIGATRAAVDAGFTPSDYQVGQTGKIVAPDLYIAVGISGAIQHVAGMKESKVIVAINKDEEAPIFRIADYGLVGDLFVELPKLCALLSDAEAR